jgi:peptidoglycan hydrolase-like protein with peptidoglycan-binding domain
MPAGAPVAVPKPQPMVRPDAQPAGRPTAEKSTADPPAARQGAVVFALAHAKPTDAHPHRSASIPDLASLARELQRELKRVGCYHGEINGVWTTSTRSAMKAFTERVNATLPIEQPDYILLSLVQSRQEDSVCSRSCPSGQGLINQGQCVPNAIIAKGTRTPPAVLQARLAQEKRLQPTEAWAVSSSVAQAPSPPPPPQGRMALAGPTTETVPLPSHALGRDDATPRLSALERRATRRWGPPGVIYGRRPPARYAQRAYYRDPAWSRALFSRSPF